MYSYFTRGTKTYQIGTDGKHYVHDSLWGAAWTYYDAEISAHEYAKAYRAESPEPSK